MVLCFVFVIFVHFRIKGEGTMLKPLFFIVLYFFASAVFSQSLIKIKHYSMQDGLSQKTIHNFVQDDNDYIWMSTWNGLERFNGYSFRNYKSYPGDSVRITNPRFLEINKSSLNNIWCLTYDKRCYLFDTQKSRFIDPFSYNRSYNNFVNKLYTLDHGITWAIGIQNELYRINENKLPDAKAIELLYIGSEHNIGSIIYDIIQDKEGDEWILTNKGITIFGRKSITNQMPFKFMIETHNEIYLATSKGLFAKYDRRNQHAIPCVLPQITSEITGLQEMASGEIAILQDKSVTFYNPANEKVTVHEMPSKIKPEIYQDSKGVIWFLGDTVGVFRLDSITGKSTQLNYPQAPDRSYAFIHEDEYGCTWVRPTDGEFCFYNPETRTLEHAFVYDKGTRELLFFRSFNYMIDRHKNLWYTDGTNIGYISFHQKKMEYIINDSKKTSARSLMEDSRKRLWVGWKSEAQTSPGGICIYDSLGQWVGNLSKQGKIVADNTVAFDVDVYCIYEDKDHNVWLGTRGDGLFLLRPKENGEYHVTNFMPDKNNANSISSTSIYSIRQDAEGRIWIGTYGGGINLVTHFPENGELHFIHSGNILNNYPIHICNKVRCIYETENGIILIGTTGGLLSCTPHFERPEAIQFYHNICDDSYSSLSNNDVLNISQDRNGKLWIVTLGGGLNLLKNSKSLPERAEFEHYNGRNSQVPDFSLSAIDDKDGNLWVSSENKILKFDENMNLLEEYADQVEITEASPLLCSSGKVILGGTFGALCILPKHTDKRNFVPPILYSHMNVYVNNISRKQNILNNKEVQHLNADERNFTVMFAALDYVNPQAIKYAYRIQGISDSWIELGGSRSVNFINVPAGDYLLQVKSTNADGIWVDNVTPLSIHVEPTFSETVWATLSYGFAGLLFLSIILYVITRIINLQRRVDFEQQLSNLKLQFFTDISHELRTPLTLIVSPIDEVINNEKLSETGIENMQTAKKNTDRMLRLINQILDFRKIQNDKMKVLIEETDVIPLIMKTYESFTAMAHTRHINFRLHCEIDSLVMYTDVDKLEKILFNLLSNAFKYTSNEKSISLSIKEEENHLCFWVKDGGRGINAQKINQLFTRFETLDKTDPNMSTGIGLSLVKKMLDLLHGTIKVESKLGEGSIFYVRLPGSYEVFKKDPNVEFILNDSMNAELSVEDTDNFMENEDKEIRILIIEDNEELRHFICNTLSKDYVILEAENGKVGWNITQSEMPDIVISDIMMPEMDGIEYLRKVKGYNDTCHIPIILLSAKASLSDQIQGLEYGADDYITKPFSSTYLKARVDSLLKQRQILYNYYVSKIDGGKNDPVDPPMAFMPQVTHFDDDFIQKLLQNIENNMQNPNFKIEDLADATALSRTVFFKKVKSLLGTSPVDFVKSMRIKRATQLLESSKYTISEIGYLCGFSTPQYFNRVFKETMNCTPKEYRSKKVPIN